MRRAALLALLGALACSKKEAPPPPPEPMPGPPRLVALPEGTVRVDEGEKMSLDLAVVSADGKGQPVVAGRELPKGAAVVNRRLEWTPDYQSAGKYTVKLVACDRGACMEQLLDIEVADDPKPPPEFKGPPCQNLKPTDPGYCPEPPRAP